VDRRTTCLTGAWNFWGYPLESPPWARPGIVRTGPPNLSGPRSTPPPSRRRRLLLFSLPPPSEHVRTHELAHLFEHGRVWSLLEPRSAGARPWGYPSSPLVLAQVKLSRAPCSSGARARGHGLLEHGPGSRPWAQAPRSCSHLVYHGRTHGLTLPLPPPRTCSNTRDTRVRGGPAGWRGRKRGLAGWLW